MCCVQHETGVKEARNVHKSLAAAPEGKKLGNIHKCKDNIKMYSKELEYEHVD
jgi:hypothetical protein